MKQSSKAPGKPCAQYFSETVSRFVCKIAPKTGKVFSGFMFMVSGKCLSSRFGVSLWGLLFPNCLASFGWAGSERRFQVCMAYTDFHLQPIRGVRDKLKSSNHQISEGHHICPSVINNVSIAAASCPGCVSWKSRWCTVQTFIDQLDCAFLPILWPVIMRTVLSLLPIVTLGTESAKNKLFVVSWQWPPQRASRCGTTAFSIRVSHYHPIHKLKVTSHAVMHCNLCTCERLQSLVSSVAILQEAAGHTCIVETACHHLLILLCMSLLHLHET